MVLNYSLAIDAIRSDLAKLYERYSENGILTNAEMTKYNRLAALEKQIVADLQPAISGNDALIEKLAEVQYEEAFYRKAWAIDQTAGVSLRWGTFSAEQVRAAVKNDLRFLARRDLAASTVNRVRRTIAQGLIRGTSLRGMMGSVRDAMNITGNDALRIVRTEAHRSRELGGVASTEAARAQGVNIVRVWDATLDDRTRSRHAALDGQPEKDGGWILGGVKASYPGDPALDPSQSINCRCTAIDQVDGYEPQVRRTQENGIQPYQTFEQWAQGRGIRSNRYGEQYDFVRR